MQPLQIEKDPPQTLALLHRRSVFSVALGVSVLLAACTSQPEWRRRAALLDESFPRPSERGQRCLSDDVLAQGLIASVKSAAFSEVWDYGPLFGIGCPAPLDKSPACAAAIGPVGQKHFPQIDLSVVVFNPSSCAQKVAKATVVFDRSHPNGFIGHHDSQTLQLTNIRFRKWNEARWNGGRYVPLDRDRNRAASPEPILEPGSELPWDAPFSDETLLNFDGSAWDRETIDFMSPWPASSFKLMVATRIMKLLDSGRAADGKPVTLATEISLPTADLVGACPAAPRTLTLKQVLDTMLQWSGNCATASLVRFLHEHHEITQNPVVDAQGFPLLPPAHNNINATLRELGLYTLQMNRTIERSGRWGNPEDNYAQQTASVANNHMTSWDAARLMWLYEDEALLEKEQRPQWRVGSDQKPVNVDFISASTKKLLRDILRDSYSGNNLVNNRLCNEPEKGMKTEFGTAPEPGILALLSSKWLDGNKLKTPYQNHPYADVVDDVGAREKDDFSGTADLSACQRIAEVEYLNKPGQTNIAGSSVGIVRGLNRGLFKGRFRRHYIVSFFSTLGSRYSDAARVKAVGPSQNANHTSLSFTQTMPRLGARLDAWLAEWLE